MGNSPVRYGRRMLVLAWVGILALLYVFFSDEIERQVNPNRTPESSLLDGGVAQIVLKRNRYGHYVANGAINGREVTFLLDTGATNISIPAAVARQLGLQRGAPVQVNTANGVITVYRTRLDRVAVGDLSLNDLNANINPHMDGDILLGMSFLKNIRFEQSGDELTLVGPAFGRQR